MAGERTRRGARVDVVILHEIARIVEARGKVPERVRLQERQYRITYLDDHRQRIEEALRRQDTDRLNMLFGQLASKVKYQLLRRVKPSAKSRKQQVTRSTAAARRPQKRARSR